MMTTEETLDRVKCSAHDNYDRQCPTCVHRYYQFLIKENYVAKYVYEDEQAKVHLLEASNRSLTVERDSLREEVTMVRGLLERSMNLTDEFAQLSLRSLIVR